KCDKKLRSKEGLKSHMRIHSNEKHFPCPRCRILFRTADNRLSHIRLLHKKQPYACLTCGKTFDAKAWLTDHLINNPGHTAQDQSSDLNAEKRAND
ncbi:hypothetical protein PMAYCL1PPCAC_22373, partial [Pristionchus mayeri]